MPRGKPSAPRLPVRSAVPTSVSHVARYLAHLDKTHRTRHRWHHPKHMTCSHVRRVRAQRHATTSAFRVEAGTEASR